MKAETVAVLSRIQRRRTKGWRMPEGAVYVGRPTRWGNPYRVLRERDGAGWMVRGRGKTSCGLEPWTKAEAAAFAVAEFRDLIQPGSIYARDAQVQLSGRDLACWCPLNQPCHADVLLEVANGAGR